MRKENKKYLGVSLSALAFSLSYGLTANAQTCVTPPSCETLGYTDTADKCDGDAMVKCPFDTSKVFCRAYPTTKVCDTIGDVLYDDKSCAIDINNLDPYRTPIGVVFDVSRKLAVSLVESGDYLQWATKEVSIPGLTTYSNDTDAIKDFNGKSNTSIIIAHGDSNGYDTPAADYCYNYTTKGTNKGDWYLPAAGELQLQANNITTLNNTLKKINADTIGNSFSSTPTGQMVWIMYSDWLDAQYKYLSDHVRPVLAY